MKSVHERVLMAAALIAAVSGLSERPTSANELVSLRGAYFPNNANQIALLGPDGTVINSSFIAPGSGLNDLSGPTGFAYGPDGNVYVASSFSGEILEYNGQTGQFIKPFVSGLDGPSALRFSGGNLYVTNLGTNPFTSPGTTVSEFKLDGTVISNGATPLGSTNNGPSGIAFDSSGNVFVSEFAANNVREFDSAGNNVQTLNSAQFVFPGGLTIDPTGNFLEVSDVVGQTVDSYPLKGGTESKLDVIDPNSPNSQFFPGSVYYLDATHFLVGSTANGELLEYTTGGTTPSVFANFIGLDQTGVSIGDIVSTNATPEPGAATLAIIGGLAGLAAILRQRCRKRAPSAVAGCDESKTRRCE